MSVTPVGGNPSKDCGCCGDLPPEANECFCVGTPYTYDIELTGVVDTYGVRHNLNDGTGCATQFDPFGFGNSLPPPTAPDIAGHYLAPCNSPNTRYTIYDQLVGNLNCTFGPFAFHYVILLDIQPKPIDHPGGDPNWDGIKVQLRSFGAYQFDIFNTCAPSCAVETSVTAYFPWIIDPDPINTCPVDLGLAEHVTRVAMQFFQAPSPNAGQPLGGAFDVSAIDIAADII